MANVKEAFKAWCSKKGYKPVRSVCVNSAVGDAALVRRNGKFSIEVSSELDDAQQAMKDAGFTHGYSYPLQGRFLTEEVLIAWFAWSTNN